MAELFLIRKGGYYYRPNAQGYTSSVHEAGRYLEAEAVAHMEACDPGEIVIFPAPAITASIPVQEDIKLTAEKIVLEHVASGTMNMNNLAAAIASALEKERSAASSPPPQTNVAPEEVAEHYRQAMLEVERRISIQPVKELLPGQTANETARFLSDLADLLREARHKVVFNEINGPAPEKHVMGRWRAFEDTTPGYWGIELEEATNDDDPIMYPIRVHRDTVARIAEAHNDALARTTVYKPRSVGFSVLAENQAPATREVV